MHTSSSTATDPPVAAPHRRSTSDRLAGGVAGATAGYLGISRTVARLLFVVASAIGGLGIVVYVVAWLFVPDDLGRVLIRGDGGRPGEGLWSSAAAALAALLVSAWLTRNGPDVLVAMLAGAGVFVLTRRGGTAPVDGAGSPMADPEADAAVPGATAGADAAGGAAATPGDVASGIDATAMPPPSVDDAVTIVSPEGLVDPDGLDSTAVLGSPPALEPTGALEPTAVLGSTGLLEPIGRSAAVSARGLPSRRSTMRHEGDEHWGPSRPTKPPRPAAFLGPLTVSVAVAVCGVLVLLAATGVWNLRLSDILITALMILGLGLLVSTWYGRARGLVVLGLLLTPAVFVSAVVDRVDLSGGIGDQRMVPLVAEDVAGEYRLGMGSLTLDLRRLDTATVEAPIRSSMSVGAGVARVYVPADWTVEIPVTVGAGEVALREPSTIAYAGDGDPPPEWSEWATSLDAYDRSIVAVDPVAGTADGGPAVRTIRSTGAEGAPELELDVDVSIGEVEVFRVEP